MSHKNTSIATPTASLIDHHILNPGLTPRGAKVYPYGEHAHHGVLFEEKKQMTMRSFEEPAIGFLTKRDRARSKLTEQAYHGTIMALLKN